MHRLPTINPLVADVGSPPIPEAQAGSRATTARADR